MNTNILILICTLLSFSATGQIADFPFYTNLDDIVNQYMPTAIGSPSIISDDGEQVLRLEGDQYLSLPNAVHEAIDPNQNVEIQMRFKITDTYTDTPYAPTGQYGEDGKRILLSNKINTNQDLGFEIYAIQMNEEYRIVMSFGDGFDNGGVYISNDTIEENAWVDLRLILQMNQEIPSLVYKLNGYYHHFPVNYIDPNIFKTSLNTQQLWVGTDKDNIEVTRDYAYAETSIDYIKIFNPASTGNISDVSSALSMMSDHINGITTLTASQQKDYFIAIVNNWDENVYAAISSDVLDYIADYEQTFGTVYETYAEIIDVKGISIPRTLQFMLIQYIVDNSYTNTNVTNMAGVSFLDHTIMPGIVDAAAPRINGTVTIDGDYNTNPGYYLNNQEFVIRPTGYYVAPGEIVNITLPTALINQDVIIHVGAHYKDLREDLRFFGRFPTIATRFPVNHTSISVANPFGGAIYVILPDGSNFGNTSITIDNAIKAPYYSSKTGFSNSLSDYQTDLSNSYVNWVDIESDNFMMTFPRAIAEISPNADAMLSPLNEMYGNFSIITGRPLNKIRSEYIISEPQIYTNGTVPAAYPMSIENGDISEADTYGLPAVVLDPATYVATFNGPVILHESGHVHNIPSGPGEGETNVDIITCMAFNTVFNYELDSAFYYTLHAQKINPDQAALDWILDTKFRNNIGTNYDEVSYQLRGLGKYIDVARLFSWDSLGLIHQYWYDEALSSGIVQKEIIELSYDEYIEAASDQLGFNFAPLWDLWGSIPSQGLVDHLDDYPRENRIKDRILHYRSLVPRNAEEFLAVYNSIRPNIENIHQVRYDDLLTFYDESVADSIYQRIDNILCQYYDTNCLSTAIDVQLEEDAITLLPNPTEGIFEISGLMEDYTIKIMTANGMVHETINCSGFSRFIDISDLPSGLLFVEIVNKQNSKICLKKIIKL